MNDRSKCCCGCETEAITKNMEYCPVCKNEGVSVGKVIR